MRQQINYADQDVNINSNNKSDLTGLSEPGDGKEPEQELDVVAEEEVDELLVADPEPENKAKKGYNAILESFVE